MAEAGKPIRIFSLAKDLGIDSKELIEHCRAAGIIVKGSALASITPEEQQTLTAYLASLSSGSAAPKPVVEEFTPIRESVPELDRNREIKTVPARRREERDEQDVPQAEPDDTPQAQPDVVESAPAPVSAVEEAPSVPEPSETAGSDAAAAGEEPPQPETPDATGGPVAAEETSSAPSDDAKRPQEQSAMKREDYIPAHGGRMRSSRSMSPISTPTHSPGLQGRRDRMKSPRQTAPILAELPKFKAAEQKKPGAGEVAQKPDIRLTPEQLEGQSPLGGHLKHSRDQAPTDDKDRKPVGKSPVGRRPGGSGTTFTDEEGPAGDRSRLASTDASRQARRKSRTKTGIDEEEEATPGRRVVAPVRKKKRHQQMELKTSATIELPITVRSLSETIGRPAKSIMTILFKRGQMVTINQGLEPDTAWEIAAELGVDLHVDKEQTTEDFLQEILDQEDPEESLVERPPVVTILGHVDHGKTSLLDRIRSTDVAGGEAGGITQHIRAYQVEHNGKKITFVDTPGHAAFGEMRARGANVTDVIVLVVAANDGVMPQTVECISHARASGAPIMVAMNKIDLPSKNEQKVLSDLSTHGVQPQEWGGDVEVIRTSAVSGEGIDNLLETILLQAEIGELKANPDRPALGVCLEAFRDEGVGPIAWIIVQKGTLRVGDVLVCGQAFGRIRAMYNDRGETIAEAPPSMPVKVAGLDIVPGAGDHFFVLEDIEEARTIAEDRRATGRAESLAGRNKPRTLDDILGAARAGSVQDLNLIIKADTPGSIEALRHEIGRIDHPEVQVQILHAAVGGVNESDIYLASASDAIIIAFHVIAEDRALQLAEAEGVEIRRYDIIYEVTDQIKRMLEGLLEPEKVQVQTGRAIVLQTFNISKIGMIAGCRVLSGTIERSHRMRVIRDQKILNDYAIASLRRVKDDVKEVREGMECGIRLEGFNDLKEGDLLEAFRIDTVKRTLE